MKKTLLLLFLCLTIFFQSHGQFITTWKTDNSGSSTDTQIMITTTGGGYDYDIYWEEVGNATHNGTEDNVTGDITLEFGSVGTYIVSITGTFPRIYFNNFFDSNKIITVEQWGDNPWTSMQRAFRGCDNLISIPAGAPDLSNVADMSYMFAITPNFSSQQDLSNWDVSNVENMAAMFYKAASFNGNISNWDVSNVTNMNGIFEETSSFNQDLSNWTINSSLADMSYMFYYATAFNQDLSAWDVSNVTNMTDMFDNSGLSPINYDATLIGWAAQTLQPNVTLGVAGLSYCNGESARTTLTSAPNNWTIDGDTKNCTQIITFEEIGEKTLGDAPFELNATASSGLPVSYTSSDENVLTIDGSTATILSAATEGITITAIQSGNGNYTATDAAQNLTVNKATQNITFELADADKIKTFGDADFDLTATASSELTVSYSSSDETVATISGSTVTIVGVGTTTITASQVGDDNYNAAADVDQPLTVNKADQMITFDALTDKVTTDTEFNLNATTSSNLALSYSSSDETVATIAGSTVTIIGEGMTTITASQAGDDNYNPATDVAQTLTVNEVREDQTITFAAIENQFLEERTLTLAATASSGLEVSYEIVSGSATVTGSNVTFTGLGMVTVSASQAGSDAFFAADNVEQSFEIITVTGVEKGFTNKVSFYPNPVNNYITIQAEDQLIQVEVLEMSGKQMIVERNKQLDVSQLTAGNYLLKVTTVNDVSVHQFIKQ